MTLIDLLALTAVDPSRWLILVGARARARFFHASWPEIERAAMAGAYHLEGALRA